MCLVDMAEGSVGVSEESFPRGEGTINVKREDSLPKVETYMSAPTPQGGGWTIRGGRDDGESLWTL